MAVWVPHGITEPNARASVGWFPHGITEPRCCPQIFRRFIFFHMFCPPIFRRLFCWFFFGFAFHFETTCYVCGIVSVTRWGFLYTCREIL